MDSIYKISVHERWIFSKTIMEDKIFYAKDRKTAKAKAFDFIVECEKKDGIARNAGLYKGEKLILIFSVCGWEKPIR